MAWDGLNWSTWDSIGGALTSSPASASQGSGRLDVLVRGTDGALWHRWVAGEGSGWSYWERLDGIVNSDPAAVSWGADRIDVYARGMDDALQQKSWDGSTWSDWTANGGGYAGSPSVASCGTGKLDVFVLRSDYHLYRFGFSGVWHQGQDLGRLVTELAAICPPGRHTIYVFGVAADGSVRMATLAGS